MAHPTTPTAIAMPRPSASQMAHDGMGTTELSTTTRTLVSIDNENELAVEFGDKSNSIELPLMKLVTGAVLATLPVTLVMVDCCVVQS